MTRFTSHIGFTAAALGAVLAAFVIAGAAVAQERTVSEDRKLATGTASAQGVDGAHPEALKKHYLDCEAAASRGALDRDAMMSCSVVYEVLKQRVFNGSFDALHAWWRQAREGAAR